MATTTNIIKTNSTSSTSRVRISLVSRRTLSRNLLSSSTSNNSMLNNSISSMIRSLLTLRYLSRIKRVSMVRYLFTLRPLIQIKRTPSSGNDRYDNLYLVVFTLLLYSIDEMSVDSRVSLWLGCNEIRISAHPIVDGVWVLVLWSYSAPSRQYIPDILQCLHVFGVYSIVNSQMERKKMCSTQRFLVKHNVLLKIEEGEENKRQKNSIQHHQEGRQRDLCINYHPPL